MSSKIFSGVLAAAKESKLLSVDRFNRMLECDDGDSAFKIALEGGFGGGAATLAEASLFERKALTTFIKENCPDKNLIKFLLCRSDFLNCEALIKCKYLKIDPADMLVGDGMFEVSYLKEKIFKDHYDGLPKPLSEALSQSDKLFVDGDADGFSVNNLFTKAYFRYMKTIANTPLLRQILSYKIDAANLISCFRCGDDQSAFDTMYVEGATISKERCLLLASLTADALHSEILFDPHRQLIEKIAADAQKGGALVSGENDADSFALKTLKENRFHLSGVDQFLLYCLYKQNEIVNVNVVVVGLNSGADKTEIKARLRESYEN